MNNWEMCTQEPSNFNYHFESRNVLAKEIPSSIFNWLRQACFDARGNKPANRSLVGHIKEEYFIEKGSTEFTDYITNSCLQEPILSDHLKDLEILTEDRPFIISPLWCNFQKKYEYNPPHTHSGVFSFVIFIQIPYDLNDEQEIYKDVREGQGNQFAARFAFLNPDYRGRIATDPIPVDKSFEGKIFMFPSKQVHQVFPFYTSDEYRITVSGNLKLKV
tara:strand:+ start:300 stop:953 length:654 start_codon:yes stop_codon:yes gene_type:complete